MTDRVRLFEDAARLAENAPTPELRELFEAIAEEWSPGFAHEDDPAVTRRMAKVTPIGRALVALMDAGDPTSDAYWSGYRDASEAWQARVDFWREECDLSTLEHSDVRLWTHRDTACAGETCPIHNRSEHSMRGFPQYWRGDRMMMERVCSHGVGHPDPDEPFVHGGGRTEANLSHGCCPERCCRGGALDV